MYEYIFACSEPDGLKIRYVKPLEQRDLARVYHSLRKALVARGRELPPELAIYEFKRLDKLYWTVDDVGLLFTDTSGHSHIFFWDKRLRGREGLCQDMAKVAMNIINKDSLWTEIPDIERAVIAFAKRIGFVENGSHDGLIKLRLTRRD